jgi:DNA adenine methylase
VSIIEGDGMRVIEQNAGRAGAVWFIDPPYTASKKKAGSRLYTHFELDHSRLFDLVGKLAGDFLMTYDHADEIKELSQAHGFETQLVAMTNTHHATMMELLVGRDLCWVRGRQPGLFDSTEE